MKCLIAPMEPAFGLRRALKRGPMALRKSGVGVVRVIKRRGADALTEMALFVAPPKPRRRLTLASPQRKRPVPPLTDTAAPILGSQIV